MTEPIAPIRNPTERRSRERRDGERGRFSTGTDLVPAPQPAPSEPGAEAAYTAQVLGQSGQKRGLKGGPPVLEQAKSAYLGAAYSGSGDRRPRPGKVTKTEI
jgi:hypothetical protein